MPKIIINRNKCEGKAICLKVCPESVLELKEPTEKLRFHSRIKLHFHGGKQAHVIDDGKCTACLKCVEACPENAINVEI